MPLPTPQQYQEAVQTPEFSFSDNELRAATPLLDSLGLPRPISGSFATVFQMQCKGKVIAVRCFLREVPDQHRRYVEIQQHLNKARLPYTVGFDYLKDGIRVGGARYPILKMEWVQGLSLASYVQRNLADPRALSVLAAHWLRMLDALRRAEIAHGDLQHGNVLVVGDQLKLIDYDGMYVPSLQGKGSNELGHRNYQLPTRSSTDFGPYLDNFSGWVVYISLLALSIKPDLWNILSGGDEALILRKRDFEDPVASEALGLIGRIQDSRIQNALKYFKSILFLPPRQVPELDEQAITAYPPKSGMATVPDWVREQMPSSRDSDAEGDYAWVPDWVRGQMPGSPQQPVALQAPDPIPEPIGSNWVLDHVVLTSPNPESASVQSSVYFEQWVILGSWTWAIATLVFAFAGHVSISFVLVSVFGILLLDLVLFQMRYTISAETKYLSKFKREQRRLNTAAAKLTESIAELVNVFETVLEEKERSIQCELGVAKSMKAKEIKEKTNAFDEKMRDIERHDRMLLDMETAEKRKLSESTSARVADLDKQINTLKQRERSELSKKLSEGQDKYVRDKLAGHDLMRAKIPGIGKADVERLIGRGFKTAADVTVKVKNVNGIGDKKSAALSKWVLDLEQRARSAMPADLLSPVKYTPTTVHLNTLNFLEGQKQEEANRQIHGLKEIQARFQAQRDSLKSEEQNLVHIKHRVGQLIDKNYDDKIVRLQSVLKKVGDELLDKKSRTNNAIRNTRQELTTLDWEQARIARSILMHKNWNFSHYIKRVFMLH